MWLKVLLLTLYLVVLFLLSRFLETVSWYTSDAGTLLTSFAALDPLALSVKKLKQLLDDRGVSYTGVVEKQELVELVQASGLPTTEEVLEDAELTKTSTESTQFTGGSHFYEEVEDTKDSAWLVQVVMDGNDPPLLHEKTWKEIRNRLADFGVRTGVFKCSLDERLCNRKGWNSARLILALPRGNRAKEDVVLHNYLHLSTSGPVVHWVRKHLSSRVRDIKSMSELQQWLSYSEPRTTELRVILISFLKSCPMFLSALAIKFNGRVKFATFDSSSACSGDKCSSLAMYDSPTYLIVTPERTLVYGKRRGESYNFRSLELFLRTFVPEMNDVFLWSLLFVNALASFELFFIYSHMWKHFVLYIVCVVKYNCVLFLLWLLVLGLYQFQLMQTCTDFTLRCLRYVSSSRVASSLRADYKSFFSPVFLLITFSAFSSAAGIVLRKFGWLKEEESSLFSNWWHVPGDTLLSMYFFRPRNALTHPSSTVDQDLEEGMELLIERLAVPNLWLQPVISMDYIKDLPMWRYRGWCTADDDNRTDGFSSDDESVILLPKVGVTPEKESTLSSQDKGEDKPLKSNSLPYSTRISAGSRVEKIEDSRAPLGMLEFRECSICLESYRYSEILCGLPCGHNFHMNCIMSWLSRDNHCCPVCRWPSYKTKHTSVHLHSQ